MRFSSTTERYVRAINSLVFSGCMFATAYHWVPTSWLVLPMTAVAAVEIAFWIRDREPRDSTTTLDLTSK